MERVQTMLPSVLNEKRGTKLYTKIRKHNMSKGHQNKAIIHQSGVFREKSMFFSFQSPKPINQMFPISRVFQKSAG